MIEDKLSKEERLRLECLAQANQTRGGGGNGSPEGVLDAARRYEAFIKGSDNES